MFRSYEGTDVIYALFLAFVCFSAGIVLTAIIQTRLGRLHSDIYQKLGYPTIIRNNTISNGLAFQKFLLTRLYRSLEDRTLNRLCDTLFWFQLFWVTAMILIPIILFNEN